MIAIITGNIMSSRKDSSKNVMSNLKLILSKLGKKSVDWEIYRSDEFQLQIKDPEDAIYVAFYIKTFFKSINLDVRMSIGLGDKSYKSKKISESNGTAFSRSKDVFETLKKNKINLVISSGISDFDNEMNLILRLCLTFMDHWLIHSAEFVKIALDNPDLSQEEIGLKLGINQAAVSRRRKRANFDLILDTEKYFRIKIKKTIS